MASIGIIANPASGKDIRRLVSYATTIDNNEKVNICQRIVMAAQAMGVAETYFMPDTFTIGYSVVDNLVNDGVLKSKVEVLDFEMDASLSDSVTAAKMMEEMGCGCVIVLGGDGTSRAAAKGIEKTPIVSVSTGTNNVYPQLLEGTVVGMAAAAVSLMDDPYSCCIKDKRIEIYVNGEYRDMALIDAVVSDDFFAGAKAIWEPERLKTIVVTRCHPATIGFSAVPGAYRIVKEDDPFGLAISLGEGGERVVAPIAAGILTEVGITEARTLEIGEPYEFTAQTRCMIALDGEREVAVREGDDVRIVVTNNGPWRVIPKLALEKAQSLGMYKKQKTGEIQWQK